MLKETVFNSRDNKIVLGLVLDGVEISADDLTKVIIKLVDDDGNIVTVDSSDAGTISRAAFDFHTEASIVDQILPVLSMKLGGESIAARDDYIATFTLYSSTYPLGLVWDDTLAISVVDP